MVNKIWTTSEANTPASTADQVQPKKAFGNVRGAMMTSSKIKVLVPNALFKLLFPFRELLMFSSV